MFGFGDSAEPFPQTVKIMEDLTKDFITRLVDCSWNGSLRSRYAVLILLPEHTGEWTQRQSSWPSNPESKFFEAFLTSRDYWERLTELLTAFEEISKGTRFKQTDEDSHDRSSKRSIKASSTSSSKRSKKSESTANDDSASVI